MVVTAARRKVETTVSITPGTHQRIIYPRWVNCDLRSVMICNNFLSLLSVSRQGRSPRAGGGVYGRENQNVNAIQTNERGRGVKCGWGGQLQSNQLQVCRSVRMSGDAAGESGFYSRLHCRNVRLFIIYQLRKMSPDPPMRALFSN